MKTWESPCERAELACVHALQAVPLSEQGPTSASCGRVTTATVRQAPPMSAFGCGHWSKIISGDRTVGSQMSQRRAQRHEQVDARKLGTGKGRLFRTRFIAECAEHLSDADAIADLAERPDDYFQSLWLESVLANRLGHPPPHPWFIEFCMRYITYDIDGLVRGKGRQRRADA